MEEAQQAVQASPTSASFKIEEDQAEEGAAPVMKDLKPMLGFLPPPERRDANLLRARKSKGGKNAGMRAAGG